MILDYILLTVLVISFIANIVSLGSNERDAEGLVTRKSLKPSIFAGAIAVQIILVNLLMARLWY